MPMWLSWQNPASGRRERIYNHYDVDDPAGVAAVHAVRRALAIKFGVDADEIPGFEVQPAPWKRAPNHRSGQSKTASALGDIPATEATEPVFVASD